MEPPSVVFLQTAFIDTRYQYTISFLNLPLQFLVFFISHPLRRLGKYTENQTKVDNHSVLQILEGTCQYELRSSQFRTLLHIVDTRKLCNVYNSLTWSIPFTPISTDSAYGLQTLFNFARWGNLPLSAIHFHNAIWRVELLLQNDQIRISYKDAHFQINH